MKKMEKLNVFQTKRAQLTLFQLIKQNIATYKYLQNFTNNLKRRQSLVLKIGH